MLNYHHRSLDDILQENSRTSAKVLRKRLIAVGLKEYRCEQCGLDKWLGRPIPIEVHHVNGNHFDNRLENIQFLCPNCHTFTDNYGNKKPKKKCVDCGRDLNDKHSQRCPECAAKYRGKNKEKISWPDASELYSLILENSFLGLSEKLGVSDTAIRKRCQKYNIPYKYNEINSLRKDNIDYEAYIEINKNNKEC